MIGTRLLTWLIQQGFSHNGENPLKDMPSSSAASSSTCGQDNERIIRERMISIKRLLYPHR